MPTTSKNTFKDKTKLAVITAVDPDKKTVDIQYVSQAGTFKALNIPYTIVGLTWGFCFMPVKGDKVVVDSTDGDRPVITSMHPNNVDYLPYLDPGEIAMICENGSYIFGRNKRKRVKSTNSLIDYDATKGPKGETDIEYEPGGLILRARSKQNRDGVTPRWDNHSYFSLFDNGDISLQSMYQGITKALLYMCGSSGYTFWSSGNGKVQEFLELNPIAKEIVLFTDGDIHTHVQVNDKQSVYNNIVKQLGGGIQINLGLDTSTIPADFDKMLADKISQGDIFLDSSTTKGNGKATLHLKGDFNITSDEGDINITLPKGKINITSYGDTDIIANGNVNVTGEIITLNGGDSPIVTQLEFGAHTHPGVQNGHGVTGTTPTVATRKVHA